MADPSLTVDATERQAATILDSLDYGILAVDGEKRISFVNRVAEGILKLAREELLAIPLDEALKTPRNSKWLVYDPDHVAKEELQRVRRVKDGNRILLRSRTIPLRDGDGAPVGSAAIFTEVPDDADEEEILNTDRDRLISLGELSASVAHEIRNPLTGIRTTVQFVQSKLPAGDSRREDLDDVIKELDRIDQIITELLLFARPQPVRSVPIEVNPLIDRVLDSLANRIEEGPIELKRLFAEDLPPVLGDADMLGQVIFNVINNAIEAISGPGELKVSTTVRRSPSGKQRVNIFVSDTGCGIPEKNMDKIFTPFFTTRSMGTGLGLSISLQIARAHGGNITPRNRRAGGATFRVSLPGLAEVPPPPEETES